MEKKQTKEDCFEVIDAAIQHLQDLRKEIEGNDKPDISVISIICNEDTSATLGVLYGSSWNFATSLASAFESKPGADKLLESAALMIKVHK